MAKPTITFAALRHILLNMDFTEVVVPKSQIGFHHVSSGAEIFLPIYKADQLVAPRHLLLVRVMLDGKALMEAEEFDRFVASNSLKHSAS